MNCDRSRIGGEVDGDCIGCPRPAFARCVTFASTHARTTTMTVDRGPARFVFPRAPAHRHLTPRGKGIEITGKRCSRTVVLTLSCAVTAPRRRSRKHCTRLRDHQMMSPAHGRGRQGTAIFSTYHTQLRHLIMHLPKTTPAQLYRFNSDLLNQHGMLCSKRTVASPKKACSCSSASVLFNLQPHRTRYSGSRSFFAFPYFDLHKS